MIVTAIKSSTTAKVSKKVRSALGRFLPTTANTASEKAMSVAAGLAHPRIATGSGHVAQTKTAAGTITPPIAATTGKTAVRGSRRSPATNSRLSSRPTMKKKMANTPSAAH